MSLKQEVLKYYSNIDKNDLNQVFSLFSDTIEYRRGERVLKGIVELKDFYNNQRALVGTHEVKRIFEDESSVLVVGTFVHNDKNIEPIRFVDIFHFGSDQKVFLRESYFNRGII